MKSWLLKRLGAVPRSEIEDLRTDKVRLETEVNRLRAEGMGKDARLKQRRAVIETGIGDIEPTKPDERKAFVASAANFYTAILEQKLKQMIAQVREDLDSVYGAVPYGMSRLDYDNFLRGTTNAFKLLMDWGEMMKGEHATNVREETNNQ